VKANHVSVIIGEMASSATIPMAQSVAIPNRVVDISPTSSAPQITGIKDNGYLWRVYPSDYLQGRVLAQAAIGAFGKGKTVNVGARNDAFGTALEQLFVAQFKKLGGKVGQTLRWNPDQANYDTEAGRLVSGSPAGYVIIDFPETFQKLAPSLVRTGKWQASRTLVTEALRVADVLKTIGAPADGLRGTAATSEGAPARAAFDTLWKNTVKGAKPYTGFEGTAFDAANLAFLAAVKACSASGPKLKAQLRSVSGPPGTKITYRQMDKAIKLLLSGRDVNYEGAWGPIDWDANGDPGSAVYEIWKYSGNAISTLKTITFAGG
jgi:ABC-type branched-subunit amino acid transport system substrate-binding protein